MYSVHEIAELNRDMQSVSAIAAAIVEHSHRPCPPPRKPWVLAMRWHDLLFIHWPMRPEIIRPLLPAEVELDTFDGWAWIGVVPFHMSGVRLRFTPPLWPVSRFAELNVRTYVKTPGRSGVWFFSLDAASKVAVRAARLLGLPYFDAQMSVEPSEKKVAYHSARIHDKAPPAEFEATYGPTGPVYYSAPDSLDRWLTARYCLYAAHGKQVVYGDIDHPPWPLQPAEMDLRVNTMTKHLGITLPVAKPLLHFARRLDVVAWPIVPLQR
jgi:uncharacterized protein YqjF (DUF2071 family)